MGLYSTIKKTGINCPDCGKEMECQTKDLTLNYKGQEFYLGDTLRVIEIDENFEGTGICFCFCNKNTNSFDVDIIKGKLSINPLLIN